MDEKKEKAEPAKALLGSNVTATTTSSFPKGYFASRREDLPDPTLEALKKLSRKDAAELTERERIYLRRARELNLLDPKEDSSQADANDAKK